MDIQTFTSEITKQQLLLQKCIYSAYAVVTIRWVLGGLHREECAKAIAQKMFAVGTVDFKHFLSVNPSAV